MAAGLEDELLQMLTGLQTSSSVQVLVVTAVLPTLLPVAEPRAEPEQTVSVEQTSCMQLDMNKAVGLELEDDELILSSREELELLEVEQLKDRLLEEELLKLIGDELLEDFQYQQQYFFQQPCLYQQYLWQQL